MHADGQRSSSGCLFLLLTFIKHLNHQYFDKNFPENNERKPPFDREA
jgi:hypothetical protein